MKARLLALGTAACLVAAVWAGPVAAATASTWQVLPTVNQEASQVTDSQFLSLSLASPADGWAVGAFDDENASTGTARTGPWPPPSACLPGPRGC